MTDSTDRPRGFAGMSAEARRALSAKGGKAGRPENRAFARDPKLAADAGRAGTKGKGRKPRGEGR